VKLVLSTPLEILVDLDEVRYVRAEDATGSFGIRDRHDHFVTVLAPSIVRWMTDDTEHFAAVDHAVMVYERKIGLHIASRRAQVSDDLDSLENQILRAFRESLDREEKARRQAKRVQLALLNRLRRYIGGGKGPGPAGMFEQ
jgi:F-type H+-transporting ATPase subunit epsilon